MANACAMSMQRFLLCSHGPYFLESQLCDAKILRIVHHDITVLLRENRMQQAMSVTTNFQILHRNLNFCRSKNDKTTNFAFYSSF
jgi:hypothetical protein